VSNAPVGASWRVPWSSQASQNRTVHPARKWPRRCRSSPAHTRSRQGIKPAMQVIRQPRQVLREPGGVLPPTLATAIWTDQLPCARSWRRQTVKSKQRAMGAQAMRCRSVVIRRRRSTTKRRNRYTGRKRCWRRHQTARFRHCSFVAREQSDPYLRSHGTAQASISEHGLFVRRVQKVFEQMIILNTTIDRVVWGQRELQIASAVVTTRNCGVASRHACAATFSAKLRPINVFRQKSH
jgi:hypothetical protein